jgi:hypothetical protein
LTAVTIGRTIFAGRETAKIGVPAVTAVGSVVAVGGGMGVGEQDASKLAYGRVV